MTVKNKIGAPPSGSRWEDFLMIHVSVSGPCGKCLRTPVVALIPASARPHSRRKNPGMFSFQPGEPARAGVVPVRGQSAFPRPPFCKPNGNRGWVDCADAAYPPARIVPIPSQGPRPPNCRSGDYRLTRRRAPGKTGAPSCGFLRITTLMLHQRPSGDSCRVQERAHRHVSTPQVRTRGPSSCVSISSDTALYSHPYGAVRVCLVATPWSRFIRSSSPSLPSFDFPSHFKFSRCRLALNESGRSSVRIIRQQGVGVHPHATV